MGVGVDISIERERERKSVTPKQYKYHFSTFFLQILRIPPQKHALMLHCDVASVFALQKGYVNALGPSLNKWLALLQVCAVHNVLCTGVLCTGVLGGC